jgi:hypothetical protein
LVDSAQKGLAKSLRFGSDSVLPRAEVGTKKEVPEGPLVEIGRKGIIPEEKEVMKNFEDERLVLGIIFVKDSHKVVCNELGDVRSGTGDEGQLGTDLLETVTAHVRLLMK